MKKNEFFQLANLKSDNIRSWGAENDEFLVLCCWNAARIERDQRKFVEIYDLDKRLSQTQQRK